MDVSNGGCILSCSQFEKCAGRELSKKWKERCGFGALWVCCLVYLGCTHKKVRHIAIAAATCNLHVTGKGNAPDVIEWYESYSTTFSHGLRQLWPAASM